MSLFLHTNYHFMPPIFNAFHFMCHLCFALTLIHSSLFLMKFLFQITYRVVFESRSTFIYFIFFIFSPHVFVSSSSSVRWVHFSSFSLWAVKATPIFEKKNHWMSYILRYNLKDHDMHPNVDGGWHIFAKILFKVNSQR